MKKNKEGHILPITDVQMTRFNITLDGGVAMVMYALENAWGGELFVPKIPSYKILDVAKAISEKLEYEIVGIRAGEKLHEEMITSSDSYNTYDLGSYYVILPQMPKWKLNDFINEFKAVKVKEGFTYNSGENTDWLSVEQIKDLISKNV
jgi:FlaA1/EpsC-like NDP-sugar epimerase